MSTVNAPSEPTGHTSTPAEVDADFGANEWLVEEMREQYLRDPNSVDSAWGSYFSEDDNSGPSTSPAPATGSVERRQQANEWRQPANEWASRESQARGVQGGTDHRAGSDQAAESDHTSKGHHTQANGHHPQALAPTPAPSPAQSAAPSPAATPAPAGSPIAQALPPTPVPAQHEAAPPAGGAEAAQPQVLRGPAARVVTNMEASLSVPTATSLRAVPAKLLIDNRIVINNHLKRSRGGKVSFTHIIAFALVQVLATMPDMNVTYTEVDGKPALLRNPHVNLGLAIDLPKPDGTRQLLVPAVKNADQMSFVQFWAAYDAIVAKARAGKLSPDDFSGVTITLTNPGTLGTVSSVPRLMRGQGAIIGVGAMEYPAEYQGTAQETLANLGVSKTMALTSTYDHRIIQGAQSGEFLRRVHQLLIGDSNFYDQIFESLRVPYEPIRWIQDTTHSRDDDVDKTARIQALINAYRVRGHLMADIDPLHYQQRRHPDLDIRSYGLTLWDLDRDFPTGGFTGKPTAPLREILGRLRDSYCRRVGVEYMHIQNPDQRKWFQQMVEGKPEHIDTNEQLQILRQLNSAEAFETFLQTKYVGQKRFSLEGAESTIPLLHALLGAAASHQLDEVCIGMPHRGRLNVLTNIAGKSYSQIFAEFEGQDPGSVHGSGDVKYHLGTEGTYTAADGSTTTVYLAANPSHLEAVNPVLEGIVRAKQDRLDHGRGQELSYSVMPILLHGDAAFAGQGVVSETLTLSQLRGYRTGGTIHVVVNNQVGFTTAPTSSRSSHYCTDVARSVRAPIFHVNGDDPEACVRVAKMAFEFRQKHHRDVVIDLVCYRRRGHNEADEPSFTQPLMYELVDKKPSVRKIYTDELIGRGDITSEQADEALKDFQAQLERAFVETRQAAGRGSHEKWEKPSEQQQSIEEDRPTSIDTEVIKQIGQAGLAVPDGFTVHPKLKPQLAKRAASLEAEPDEPVIEWATAEALAFGSLLLEGRHVRVSGQDCRRGTFGHRHAVLIDRANANEYTPLANLSASQGRFWIYDSLLSEYAALGYEYGYSITRPDALVVWEAQFGDFVDVAQPIIDEFISSGQQKWGQRSGLVLLLPHGYEGQGPDHSSARPERFLQLFAEDNMTIAWPSTPASYFHLLRRQAYTEPRRPLIVFSPKSLLRMPAAASRLEEFTQGGFHRVLGDSTVPAEQVQRVLLCSGKVFYELQAERSKRNDATTALIRLEQLAPLPGRALAAELAKYPNASLTWVQEEPANQGAWSYLAMNLPALLGGRALRVASRPASASPAAGSHRKHADEQANLLREAFEG